jgi:hypothetical protein
MRESPCSLINDLSFRMSHKNSLLWGLFAFFIVFLLSACQRPEDSTGLDLIPGEDLLLANQTDTVSIIAITDVTDSVFLDERATVLLGTIYDPIFGTTRADIFCQLAPLNINPDFPASFVVDSVVLSLSYFGSTWGNAAPQQFLVNELSAPIYLDTAYTRMDSVPVFTGNLINTAAPVTWQGFKLDPFTGVRVGNDTVAPQLRIPLLPSLGQRLLSADPSVYASNTAFKEHFRGIRISGISDDGGICDVDLLNSNSRIRVFFKDLDGTPDTTFFDYQVTSSEARFNRIRRSYSLSDLEPLAASTSMDASVLGYSETVGGTRVLITFPHLDDFKVSGRTINRAELVVPFEPNETFNRPAFLFAQYRNAAGNLVAIPDYGGGSISVSGQALDSPSRYRLNISRFIQAYLEGEIAEPEIYISALEQGITPKRVVLHGPEFAGETWQKMRLVITYSE